MPGGGEAAMESAELLAAVNGDVCDSFLSFPNLLFFSLLSIKRESILKF
jgi:hypothetical protein